MSFKLFATVIIDQKKIKPLDYGVPDHLKEHIHKGSRVLISLRNQMVKGTVLYVRGKTALSTVEPILDVLMEKQKIPEDLFALANWMAQYYATPLRKCLNAILPSAIRDEKTAKQQIFIKRSISKPQLIEWIASNRYKHPSQARVCELLLKNDPGLFLSDILDELNISASPVESLIKHSILKKEMHTIDRMHLLNDEYFQTHPKKLTEEQQKAFQSIAKHIDTNVFHTHLLHGITGSGKTEIYLQLIQKALDAKKSVIMLVPEIALTAQTIERIKGRFQSGVAILHYRLSDGEKRDTWKNILSGNIQIVVGARSAIFSPLPNLGLIIIDEEQDGSFKQSDEMPCYNGRDVAIMRAKLCQCVALLGSATPSLESYHNALNGKYHLSTLKTRASASLLPDVSIIDMQLDREKASQHRFFSETLLSKMRKKVALGEQVILFLNRRGTYSTLKCKECDYVAHCPHCDQTLTFYRSYQHLACHLCGYTSLPPSICPSCQKGETIQFRSPGTDQIERSLNAMFPDIRTLRMDGDTTRKKGSHDRLFKQFRAGKADVLIGTQMIAKGLHFPSVTLVGVLNSDSSLNIPDFRSAEYAFQLITQVSGRAGRSELPGEVILQTRMPEHPIFTFASKEDYIGFYNQEVEGRKLFGYPPFAHLIKVVISHPDEATILTYGQDMRKKLIKRLPPTFTMTPFVPCMTAKIKDRYRFHFLIKGNPIALASHALKEIYDSLKIPKDLRCLIDVDPRETI